MIVLEPASAAQIKSIQDFYKSTVELPMSVNQANTLLSVRDYVRAVATIVRNEGLRVSGDHMRIVAAWMISDRGIAEDIRKWNASRFHRRTHNETPRLRRSSPLFIKVHAKMRGVAWR